MVPAHARPRGERSRQGEGPRPARPEGLLAERPRQCRLQGSTREEGQRLPTRTRTAARGTPTTPRGRRSIPGRTVACSTASTSSSSTVGTRCSRIATTATTEWSTVASRRTDRRSINRLIFRRAPGSDRRLGPTSHRKRPTEVGARGLPPSAAGTNKNLPRTVAYSWTGTDTRAGGRRQQSPPSPASPSRKTTVRKSKTSGRPPNDDNGDDTESEDETDGPEDD